MISNNSLFNKNAFTHCQKNEDYAHVWSILGNREFRDSRKAIEWQRPITPIVESDLVQASSQSSLPASVWSSPQCTNLDADTVKSLFKQHFIALNIINKKQREARCGTVAIPDPLKLAWQRHQDSLIIFDCLELLDILAFDETEAIGLRWGDEVSEPLIKSLNSARLDKLKVLLDNPNGLTIKQKRALLMVTVNQNWFPGQPSNLLQHIPKDQLQEFREFLKYHKDKKLYWLGT